MGFKIQNNRSRKREPMSEINVTPFVDVMLVLLIIFMVTAPMLTAGVAVNLPDSSANSLPDDKEPLTLSINAKGETFIQETAIDYGRVMEVMGLLSRAGFTKVALISGPPISKSKK
ncbi:MAG: ExbD/TolR family protein [Candidatus Fonsibacter ubiquis]|nr:ExbD/TolR family protein [Candidatus Fonsibacter ubiquis]